MREREKETTGCGACEADWRRAQAAAAAAAAVAATPTPIRQRGISEAASKWQAGRHTQASGNAAYKMAQLKQCSLRSTKAWVALQTKRAYHAAVALIVWKEGAQMQPTAFAPAPTRWRRPLRRQRRQPPLLLARAHTQTDARTSEQGKGNGTNAHTIASFSQFSLRRLLGARVPFVRKQQQQQRPTKAPACVRRLCALRGGRS